MIACNCDSFSFFRKEMSSNTAVTQNNYYINMLTVTDGCAVVIVAQQRLSHFVVGLTNNNPHYTDPVYKQYRHAQYDKILPVGATGSVSFAAPAVFRYVIVQQQFSTADSICMIEVKVFKRGTTKPSAKEIEGSEETFQVNFKLGVQMKYYVYYTAHSIFVSKLYAKRYRNH